MQKKKKPNLKKIKKKPPNGGFLIFIKIPQIDAKRHY